MWSHTSHCDNVWFVRDASTVKRSHGPKLFSCVILVYFLMAAAAACHSGQSDLKTSSAWPITVTFGQTRTSVPLGSKRNVERWIAFLP